MTSMYSATVTVTLKSDMCCGTGESDGVAVDLVTALDAYGLPIIPAKRLKGLLRESAELIVPEGKAGRLLVEGLFGHTGDKQGKLRFETATLEDADDIRAVAKKDNLSPQRVADVYTVTRSGTRIEDDGVAADQSLRTIQLVNHLDPDGEPTKFVFKVTSDGVTPDEKKLFIKAVKCLRAIGMGKSRGMGEVKCEVTELEPEMKQEGLSTREGGEGSDTDTMVTRRYHITLKADAILSGGAGQALDCIPGSMLQGIFAREAARNGMDALLAEHILKGSCFSNAYLDVDGKPSRPVPITYKVVKNAAVLRPGDLRYYDEARAIGRQLNVQENSTPCQLVGLSGYTVGNGSAMKVSQAKMSYSFHSSTTSSAQGKQFYSLRHLTAGQCFSGTITAAASAMKEFESVVENRKGSFSVGASTSAGYGACKLEIDADASKSAAIDLKAGSWAAIELVSDFIFIDECGCNNTDVGAFAKWLNKSGELGFKFSLERAFVRMTTVGGYNAEWGMPKRQCVAFGKGSVLVVNVTEDAKNVPDSAWVGVLNAEGFGQLYVSKVNPYEEQGDGPVVLSGERSDSYETRKAESDTTTRGDTESKVVKTFLRGVRFLELKEELCGREKARHLASEFVRGFGADASKSSAMRIGNTLRTAEKESNTGKLAEKFISTAGENFRGDEALKKACSDLKAAFDASCAGGDASISTMHESKLDQLFSLFVRTYLSYVKQGYIAKDAAGEEEGGSYE